MTKADIIETVSSTCGFSKKESAELVECVFSLVKGCLESGSGGVDWIGAAVYPPVAGGRRQPGTRPPCDRLAGADGGVDRCRRSSPTRPLAEPATGGCIDGFALCVCG